MFKQQGGEPQWTQSFALASASSLLTANWHPAPTNKVHHPDPTAAVCSVCLSICVCVVSWSRTLLEEPRMKDISSAKSAKSMMWVPSTLSPLRMMCSQLGMRNDLDTDQKRLQYILLNLHNYCHTVFLQRQLQDGAGLLYCQQIPTCNIFEPTEIFHRFNLFVIKWHKSNNWKQIHLWIQLVACSIITAIYHMLSNVVCRYDFYFFNVIISSPVCLVVCHMFYLAVYVGH